MANNNIYENIVDEKNEEEKEEEEKANAKFLCMSKELLPCKLLFFVLYINSSSVFSFISLFYTSSGLTVSQLGLMNGIACGFSLFAQPLWGAVVDATTKHRNLLFISLSLGSTALEFGKPWLIMLISDTRTVIKCFHSSTSSPYSVVPSAVYSTNYLSNHFPVFVNTLNQTNCTRTVELLNPDIVFLGATINSVLSTIVMSGLMSYLDFVILRTVFNGRKKEHSYGKQKVLGPIGMAIGSFGTGVAVDHYQPKRPFSPYLAAFYIYLPLSFLLIPLLYILTKQIKWDDQKKKEKQNKSELSKHLKMAFKNTDTLMFLASTFIAGLASTVLMDYMFLFMNDVMHPSKTVMSLTTVVAAISEVFVYPFTSKLIKLFGGHMTCIISAMVLHSVRLAGVSFCTNALYVLPLQLLNGFTSALAWTAMMEHTWKIFPKEIINMAIGIFYAFNMTATSIISNIGGGFLYRKFGGARVFQGMAIVNTSWCVVMLFYFVLRKRPMKVSSKVLTVQSRQVDVELKPE